MAKRFKEGAGLTVLIGAATVEQTGIKPGAFYRFTTVEDGCVVEFGAADATTADGGFAFAIAANESVDVLIPTGITAINVIESSIVSSGTAVLFIAEYENV